MPIEAKFKENPKWEKILNNAIEIGLEKTLIRAKNKAKKNAPFDTGKLKNNNFHERRGFTGIVYNTMEYAPYVEYGTKRMKAQPFMRKVLYDNYDSLMSIINNELRKVLK